MKKFIVVTYLLLCLACALTAVPRRYVVMEVTCRTTCPLCPGCAMGADDLMAYGKTVAVIVNHVQSDPFSNTYSVARATFYGTTATPWTYFDGLNGYGGGSGSSSLYSTYWGRISPRLAVAAHYTISATGTASGNSYTANVVVAKPEDDTNTNVVLHAVVTESEMVYTWFSQTTVDFANRLMIPNQSGTPISLATGGQVTVPLSFSLNPAYNTHNCELVLFLQNTSTKEILQAEKYPFDFLYKDFSATPISGTAPLDVQFANSANAYGNTIGTVGLGVQWDFENDGTFDSNVSNPLHNYAQAGTYSVKYKVTFRGGVEELIKTAYINVAPPVLPLAPQDIQITMSGTDFLLSWDAVTQDSEGNPIVPDYYEVLYSDDPYADIGNFTLLTTTTGLSAADLGAALTDPSRFYVVRAVKL